MDLFLIILIIGIPAIAQLVIMNNYNRYSMVPNSNHLSGMEIARKILDENNLKDVDVVEVAGTLTDNYDPSQKVVHLSSSIYHGTNVSSTSVAAHECGHAIQDKENYSFMRFREAIFPVVNIATSISYWIILIGFILELIDLVYIGIAFTLVGLLFQIITLPVEFDASKRAKECLDKYTLATPSEETGVNNVLGAAAMTYVAGVLASSIQILRLILMTRNRD
jgi:uncharacterized protein